MAGLILAACWWCFTIYGKEKQILSANKLNVMNKIGNYFEIHDTFEFRDQPIRVTDLALVIFSSQSSDTSSRRAKLTLVSHSFIIVLAFAWSKEGTIGKCSSFTTSISSFPLEVKKTTQSMRWHHFESLLHISIPNYDNL